MRDFHREMVEMYKKSLGEKKDYSGIVCPTTYHKPCRLCDLCKEILFNKRDYPKDHPVRIKASSLNAKFHYFSNVLFIADPSEIVIFEYGEKVFKQLLALQMDETQPWQNFFDPLVGRWLVIERIQGATKEQVDYYVKPRDVTKLPDLSILSKLGEDKYNLSNIVENTKEGKVKSIYQSKLDKLTTIRVLPSWLGPKDAFKFFEKVDFHYNISEEDFKSCMAGELNPIRVTVSTPTPVTQVDTSSNPATSSWEAYIPKADKGRGGIASEATVEKDKADQKLETKQMGFEDDEFPPCYGDYDEGESSCNAKECPEWRTGCMAYTKEKLEKRRSARKTYR